MNSNHKLSLGDLEELLPWHAAGTLDSDEAAEVERALAADPELARRFALVREELTETILLERVPRRAVGAGDGDAVSRHRPGSQGGTPRRARPDLGARIAQFFSPRTLAWTASAAAVIVLLQAGVITRLVMQEHEGAAPPVQAAAATDMPTPSRQRRRPSSPADSRSDSYALVRFAPQASIGDINKFLDARDAAIVDGPKPGGVYRVRVAQGSLSRQELARTVKELEADKSIVSFAAPTE